MGKIALYTAMSSCTTGIGGTVTNQLKIPGTFSSMDGSVAPANGRWLKETMIWTDAGAVGDKLTLLRIEDVDGVIPVPARAAFPDYPVLSYLMDQEVESPGAGGLFIPVGQLIRIQPIDPLDVRGLQFIPSGLYLCSTFTSGGLSLSKTCRINYLWGKYIETS